jgi:acetyltransferase-like isoleucine patch superfamily enzyme
MIFYIRLITFLRTRFFNLLYSHRFGKYGKRTYIVAPVGIEGERNIFLADDVYVAAASCLAARPLTGAASCRLEIGRGTRIGRFNHLYATGSIILEEHVLTANGVYISDNQHDYRDPETPIVLQPVVQRGAVRIGAGSWLGHNACIMGASLGRHCVVGANSVITKDIPDFCVVVGSPGKIVRRFDTDAGEWKATREDGTFLG